MANTCVTHAAINRSLYTSVTFHLQSADNWRLTREHGFWNVHSCLWNRNVGACFPLRTSTYTGCPRGKGECSGMSQYRSFCARCVYLYMCPISSCFTYVTLYRRAARHVLARVAKCIDVSRTNFVTWTISTGIRNSAYYLFLVNNFGPVQWSGSLSGAVQNRAHARIYYFFFS
jgi:hypothetical protein